MPPASPVEIFNEIVGNRDTDRVPISQNPRETADFLTFATRMVNWAFAVKTALKPS
jgi:hypothetical protein